MNITLDELGPGAGRPVEDPENWLPRYDLVLGKGRCALEAMAVGPAVILIGSEGMGELVTPENFAAFKKRNFGLSLLRPGMNPAFLEEQVLNYSAGGARQVQEMVRATCSLEIMVETFMQLYNDLPARGLPFARSPDGLPVGMVASWCGPLLHEHAGLWVQQLQAEGGPPSHEREIKAVRDQLGGQRHRAEHYRAEARKYKTRALELQAKLALHKQAKKSLWAWPWSRKTP